MTYTKWEMENLPKIIRKRKMRLKNLQYMYNIAKSKNDFDQIIAIEKDYISEMQLLDFNLKQLASASETFKSINA